MNLCLRQIIGGLKAQFDKKQIELVLASHQRVFLTTDKYKLSQCIYNILTNAYKYTGTKGKVIVADEAAGDDILISIEDKWSWY